VESKLFTREPQRHFSLLIVFALAFSAVARCEATVVADSSLPRIATNTNQHAAGTLSEGALTVELEIREGAFYPEDESGPSLQVFAFAERGKQLQIPGPMIRILRDTTIHVTVHNLIARDVLIHGLHTRPGRNEDTIEVAAGATRDVTFSTGAPGAYYYWATAGGDTLAGRPYKEDSQLHGAFIVDPRGTVAPDRVFVIGMWRDRPLAQESFDVPVINGKSWPFTERLEYPLGDEVRWVWLNPSGNVHPMHMHGSYFKVLSEGDAERDSPVPSPQIHEVSTNFMAVGGDDDHPLETRADGPLDLSLPHPYPYISGDFGLSSRECARRNAAHGSNESHGGPCHGNHDSASGWETSGA
jgi:FtsP/CotA-like multicopper oxidase with cupredoxin domain